jgi:hypothetical protein
MRTRNALAVLMGRPPGPLPELSELAGKEGVIPLVDRAVLPEVPASLLLRRPDIRAWSMCCPVCKQTHTMCCAAFVKVNFLCANGNAINGWRAPHCCLTS